jgi:hypothetical protein
VIEFFQTEMKMPLWLMLIMIASMIYAWNVSKILFLDLKSELKRKKDFKL